ncbi:lysozyme inhibitor [Acinetobacter sp. RF15A]|uniref:lysozyme inhibitor n=1 Tax=unclassified Acinetobacter TaxID=196816 RepID=UPI00118FDAA6|nr:MULTISPECIES: lysozyme inhibitor [unclassified Acinetobacter]TSH73985.1 lysozyme inhibitor [Acinetobacter sp. RF15A]TSI20370.1 lysozyme inhibitor [Acinetobacter sp. RF15B]
MKYIIGASLLALALAGCNSSPPQPTESTPPVESTPSTPAETQVINFVGPMDLTIQLKSSDNFETAEMTDNSGKVHHLKQTVAASGVRLANDQGVSIHFKRGEGVVELVKGKPINITEYKK